MVPTMIEYTESLTKVLILSLKQSFCLLCTDTDPTASDELAHISHHPVSGIGIAPSYRPRYQAEVAQYAVYYAHHEAKTR